MHSEPRQLVTKLLCLVLPIFLLQCGWQQLAQKVSLQRSGGYDRDLGTWMGSSQRIANEAEKALWRGHRFAGKISWYGPGFEGKTTASGELFDPGDYTCAHPTLPFGLLLEVRLANGAKVKVRVNDRGPFSGSRVLDLSQSAAEKLGLKTLGVAEATIEVVE